MSLKLVPSDRLCCGSSVFKLVFSVYGKGVEKSFLASSKTSEAMLGKEVKSEFFSTRFVTELIFLERGLHREGILD